MAVLTPIVYIGEKETKRITWSGRRYIFPRFTPVEIEERFAYQLLDCPDVFARPEAVEEIKKQQEELAAEQEAKRQAAEEAAKKELVESSGLVIVNGEKFDINKVNTAKINTWIVAEDLDIDANSIEREEGETPKQALVRVVRAALHEKNGNPEAEEA